MSNASRPKGTYTVYLDRDAAKNYTKAMVIWPTKMREYYGQKGSLRDMGTFLAAVYPGVNFEITE